MSSEHLRALVVWLARDRRRFTLEDAERRDEEDKRDGGGAGAAWVAYLYDACPGLTYRVADDRVLHAWVAAPALPEAWAVHEERPARNAGRDYSEEEARISLAELALILAHDAAGAPCPVCTLHVRYEDDGDDRYRVVVRAPTGELHELTTLAAYLQAQRLT